MREVLLNRPLCCTCKIIIHKDKNIYMAQLSIEYLKQNSGVDLLIMLNLEFLTHLKSCSILNNQKQNILTNYLPRI